MSTSDVKTWVQDHTLVVVYVLFAANVFLVIGLYRQQTDARIDGDLAVTQQQIDDANTLRQESDVRNCLGAVDFRLSVIGLAEEQLAELPIDPNAPPEVVGQVETISERNERLLATVRSRFAPPACVSTLRLDTDGDGWPEDLEPAPPTGQPAPSSTTTTAKP